MYNPKIGDLVAIRNFEDDIPRKGEWDIGICVKITKRGYCKDYTVEWTTDPYPSTETIRTIRELHVAYKQMLKELGLEK